MIRLIAGHICINEKKQKRWKSLFPEELSWRASLLKHVLNYFLGGAWTGSWYSLSEQTQQSWILRMPEGKSFLANLSKMPECLTREIFQIGSLPELGKAWMESAA